MTAIPIRIAPFTLSAIRTTISAKQKIASSTFGSPTCPSLTGTSGRIRRFVAGSASAAAGIPWTKEVTIPVSYRPMKARNSPIAAAKL